MSVTARKQQRQDLNSGLFGVPGPVSNSLGSIGLLPLASQPPSPQPWASAGILSGADKDEVFLISSEETFLASKREQERNWFKFIWNSEFIIHARGTCLGDKCNVGNVLHHPHLVSALS